MDSRRGRWKEGDSGREPEKRSTRPNFKDLSDGRDSSSFLTFLDILVVWKSCEASRWRTIEPREGEVSTVLTSLVREEGE